MAEKKEENKDADGEKAVLETSKKIMMIRRRRVRAGLVGAQVVILICLMLWIV